MHKTIAVLYYEVKNNLKFFNKLKLENNTNYLIHFTTVNDASKICNLIKTYFDQINCIK